MYDLLLFSQWQPNEDNEATKSEKKKEKEGGEVKLKK